MLTEGSPSMKSALVKCVQNGDSEYLCRNEYNAFIILTVIRYRKDNEDKGYKNEESLFKIKMVVQRIINILYIADRAAVAE